MNGDNSVLTSLQVNLRDKQNGTYRGHLVLKNWTLWYGHNGSLNYVPDVTTSATDSYDDPSGAGFFVIAVVLVYSMSIVMLIASHINQKHTKLIEDRQIHKYLQEFQIVKDRSSQDQYKQLKERIREQIKFDKSQHKANKAENSLRKSMSQALLPIIAVTMPTLGNATSVNSLGYNCEGQRSRSSSIGRLSSVGGYSSPNTPPRSRSGSFGEVAGVHRTQHGNFLGVPESGYLSDSQKSPHSPRHHRRNGVINYINQTLANKDRANHLEKILEESLDSRRSSIRRNYSKQSKLSELSSPNSSMSGEAGNGHLQSSHNSRKQQSPTQALERSGDSRSTSRSSEHQLPVNDSTCAPTRDTPDVVLHIQNGDHHKDKDDIIEPYTSAKQFSAQTKRRKAYSVQDSLTEDEIAIWVLSSQEQGSDDENSSSESYITKYHKKQGLPLMSHNQENSIQQKGQSINTQNDHSEQAKQFRSQNGDHFRPIRRHGDGFSYKKSGVSSASRLTPLWDNDSSESDQESGSESSYSCPDDGNELIHVTCI